MKPAAGGAILSLLIPLVFYLLTLCPTVYWIDSGELIASAYSLGIAHPTGYPLYVLLGRLFSLVPGGAVAARISALSAVSGAAASMFIYLSSLKLTGKSSVALVCALTASFSLNMWNLSNTAEVYALNVLMTAVAVFLLIRFRDGKCIRDLYLLAFLLGLGMTNHLTLGVMIPAAAIVIFGERGLLPRPFIGILVKSTLFFLLGFTLYLYIPLRASESPPMNWGNPRDLASLLDTLSLSSQSDYFFSRSVTDTFEMLKGVKSFFLDGFGIPASLLAAAGLFLMFLKRRILALSMILPVVILTVFVINFGSGHRMAEEQQAFYLPVTVFVSLFMAEAVTRAVGYCTGRLGRRSATAVILLTLLVPASLAAVNYRRVDKSSDRSAVVFASLVYEAMEKPALLLTDHTTLAFLFMYSRVVESRWNDVVPVYIPLLEETWYREELAETFDGLVLDPDKDFENLALFVRDNDDVYTVYTRQAYQQKIIPDRFLLPCGPVMMVKEDSVKLDPEILALHRRKMIPFEADGPSLRNKYFRANLVNTYLEVGSLSLRTGLHEEAARDIMKAQLLDPESPVPYLMLSRIREMEGKPEEALDLTERALLVNSQDPGALVMKGTLLEQEGKTSEAQSAYQQAVDSDPGFAPAHGKLGILLYRNGDDPAGALFHLKESIRLGYPAANVAPIIKELEARGVKL